LANGITLSSEQQEILVGTILGDGHLVTSNNGRTFSLKLEHAFSQKDYIDWLYMKLESLVLTRPQLKHQTVRGKVYQKYYFNTLGLPALQPYGQLFYRKRKKVVPGSIASLMTPLSLAVWFMDDGSCKSRFHKARIFNTQSFCENDLRILQEMMLHKFQIATTLRKQREGKQIYIPSVSVDRFIRLIEPFIIPSMEYKIKFNKIA
jgi:hypothetical protein